MEFKQLEVKQDTNWFKRIIQSPHTKKSVIYTVIGAIGGLVYFYLSQGKHMEVIVFGDVLQSVFVGAFFGFFITNSPCARNKC
jgi:hypothetical protein